MVDPFVSKLCIQATLSSLTLCMLSSSGLAQSFNIDIGETPEPIPPFPGAAGQPGHWNMITTAEAVAGVALVNIGSVLTPVMLAVDVAAGGDFTFDSCIPPTDAAKLMEDVQDIGAVGGVVTYTFTGLVPGMYEVYTYAWAPDVFAFISDVTGNCSSDPTEMIGGFWCGLPFVRGITHALHRTRVSAGGDALSIEIATGAGLGRVNGFQIVLRSPTGTPGCFGDGTDEACPCLNFGVAGHGCENSEGTGGALLEAFGVADVGADSLVLVASSLRDTTPVLFFQGTVPLDLDGDGDFGLPLDDGLRCVGGAVIRLGIKTSECGVASYPGLGDLSVSVKGGVAAGDTLYYQCWYRDPDGMFCSSGTSNLSNGLEIGW